VPALARRPVPQRVQIAVHLRQGGLRTLLRHQPQALLLVVPQQRGGKAGGKGRGQPLRCRGEAHAGFHLGGQFIAQVQEPAALERQPGYLARQALFRPPLVETGEKTSRQLPSVPAQDGILQHQGFARKGEQDVEAFLLVVGRTFQQVGIARRKGPVQGQQVDRAGQALRHGQTAQIRRRTRVPLVPPKPKELDMATSIFISAPSCGTIVQVALRDPG
jgi:hypothetical protein